jgi:hypothetical protein
MDPHSKLPGQVISQLIKILTGPRESYAELGCNPHIPLYLPETAITPDLSRYLAELFMKGLNQPRPHGPFFEDRVAPVSLLLKAALSGETTGKSDVTIFDRVTGKEYTVQIIRNSALESSAGSIEAQLSCLRDESQQFAPTHIFICSEAAVRAAHEYADAAFRGAFYDNLQHPWGMASEWTVGDSGEGVWVCVGG